MQEQPVIRRSEDIQISVGVGVGVGIVVVLAAAATASSNEGAYEAALTAIFGVAPHEAPLAAHPPPPPPPSGPIVILPRPDPLGNEDGPGGEDDSGILMNWMIAGSYEQGSGG